jgi:hypothetical protein
LMGAYLVMSDRLRERHDFDWGSGRASVHKLVATVPREEWGAYFGQMREFARESGLKIRVARLKPDRDIYFVDLWRDNVMLTGGNVFDSPEFHSAIYIDPDKGGTVAMADVLFDRLKQILQKVPGAAIEQSK